MASPRTVLVVNPKSQNGAVGRKWPHLAAQIRRELGSFEEQFTQGPNHATALCRQAIEDGAERVIAVGGDGTINEVVNGFFDNGEPIGQRTAFGVIPVGTGGDFRKSVKIPNNVADAARLVSDGDTRAIDVGKLEYKTRDGQDAVRMFINIASFGLSGLTDEMVNRTTKRFGSKLTFLIGTTRAALKYNNQRVRLAFDGDETDGVDMTINTVAIANGRYFGGGMFVAPEAEVDDGYFDVVAMGDLTLFELLANSRRLYSGTHLSLDKVSHRRAKRIRAEPVGDDDVLLDVDGEVPGILPATFSIVPGALALVAPSG